MNYEIKRMPFLIGLVSISMVIFTLSYFIAVNTELRLVNLIIIASGFPITILVHSREKDIKPNFRWRPGYIAIMSLLLAIAVSLIYTPHTADSIAYKEAQVSLGYFFFYLVLSLPIFISCSFQK